jgi:hypothetical protein
MGRDIIVVRNNSLSKIKIYCKYSNLNCSFMLNGTLINKTNGENSSNIKK